MGQKDCGASAVPQRTHGGAVGGSDRFVPDVAARVAAVWVDRAARKGTGPSDHAPLIVDLDGSLTPALAAQRIVDAFDER